MVPVGQTEEPFGMQGGFAIVYKFRTKSGQLKALRVFTKDMPADTQYRYDRIGPYFAGRSS